MWALVVCNCRWTPQYIGQEHSPLVSHVEALVSLTTPQHKYIQTHTVLYMCPVLYILTFHNVIHLISRSSVHVGALSPIGYESHWPLSAAFCVYLCFLFVTLSHLGVVSVLFAPISILGREPFVPIWVSSRIYLGLLRWFALRVYLCIVSLICGACCKVSWSSWAKLHNISVYWWNS